MIPLFEHIDELKGFIELECKGDKGRLVRMKQAAVKYADSVSYSGMSDSIKADTEKAGIIEQEGELNKNLLVRSVINTTNILDSHGDVHINGLWKKSLQESKGFYLLQEHKMTFANIISQEVVAGTKNISWKKLGYDFEGSSQALVFDSLITPDRNPFMYEQYSKGYVNNHSVGMRYVKGVFCVNSDEKYWVEEKANWDKYIVDVVNKEEAEELGYFYAVLEAKIIEGSAVVIGSNRATPTLSTKDDLEVDKVTSIEIEPSKDTQDLVKQFYSKLKF
jgi:hypothetical protein